MLRTLFIVATILVSGLVHAQEAKAMVPPEPLYKFVQIVYHYNGKQDVMVWRKEVTLDWCHDLAAHKRFEWKMYGAKDVFYKVVYLCLPRGNIVP